MSICQLKCTSRCTVERISNLSLELQAGLSSFLTVQGHLFFSFRSELVWKCSVWERSFWAEQHKVTSKRFFFVSGFIYSSDKQSDHGYLKVVFEVKCSLLLMLDPCLSLFMMSLHFFSFCFSVRSFKYIAYRVVSLSELRSSSWLSSCSQLL